MLHFASVVLPYLDGPNTSAPLQTLGNLFQASSLRAVEIAVIPEPRKAFLVFLRLLCVNTPA